MTLAQDIARSLGRAWSVETQPGHAARCWLTDGPRRLSLAPARNSRLRIKGDYDGRPDWGWREPPPSISVAQARGGAAIAQEIQRRLLPAYAAYVERRETAYAKHSGERHAEMDALNLLAEVTHGQFLPDRKPGNMAVRFGQYGSFFWPYGKADSFDRGRLKLELDDLTPAEAEQVLELIIKLRGQQNG